MLVNSSSYSQFDEPYSFVGWAVAVNSGGTFVFSPLLGKWADWRGVREAIFFSLILMIGGNLLYSLSMNVWVLLVARFIVGCAAGMSILFFTCYELLFCFRARV